MKEAVICRPPRTPIGRFGGARRTPAGATCARIVATLLHEMRRQGARYALETLCIGGGQGIAAVFERVGE